MVDAAQILQTAGTSVLQSLLPGQPAAAAPQVTYVQAKPINWLLWGGIGLGGLAVLMLIMKRSKGSTAAAAPATATNPRRRRKVRIHRRRR